MSARAWENLCIFGCCVLLLFANAVASYVGSVVALWNHGQPAQVCPCCGACKPADRCPEK